MTHSILQFNKVAKRINTCSVLRGIDLAIQRGEIFALIGENGAGKTTLIKSLFDLVSIDDGEIQIDQISHRAISARRGVAYLPERFRPPYHLSGREFLTAQAQLSGVKVSDGEIEKLCQTLELNPAALANTIGKYSKGMGQKLGLVASLLTGKKLLVLDEPMSGLDAKARILLKGVLGDRRDAGRSIFLSTHLLNDAGQLCDRLGVLHKGSLRFVGTPANFCAAYNADNVEQAYLTCVSQ